MFVRSKPAASGRAGRCGVPRRWTLAAMLMTGGILAAALCAGGSNAARSEEAKAAIDGKTVEIHIDNFAFTPAEVTIAPGTTVKWVNRDDIPHTVVEKAIAFKSKPMDTDDSYTHTFETAGDVDYFCSLHPHMTGKIIVKAP